MTPVLKAAGYDLFIAPGGTTVAGQDAVIDSLIDHQMDGIVLIGPRQSPDRLERIAALIPAVVVGRHGPAENYDTIASDDELGSELIIEHLYDLGHRQISFIAESPDVDYPTLPEHVRLQGYLDAMRRRRLDDQIDVIASDWSIAGGRRASHILESRSSRPTAVHAGADVAALGLLSALWEQGWDAPSRFSIAGYDNSPTAAFARIGITSIEQGGVHMGETAAELLIARIRGRTSPVHELTPPTLVPRRTTASVHLSTRPGQ
jgi:LacI family transcriptional regulator